MAQSFGSALAIDREERRCRRNAATIRERRRYKQINESFIRLSKLVTFDLGRKKCTQLEILERATSYISELADLVSSLQQEEEEEEEGINIGPEVTNTNFKRTQTSSGSHVTGGQDAAFIPQQLGTARGAACTDSCLRVGQVTTVGRRACMSSQVGHDPSYGKERVVSSCLEVSASSLQCNLSQTSPGLAEALYSQLPLVDYSPLSHQEPCLSASSPASSLWRDVLQVGAWPECDCCTRMRSVHNIQCHARCRSQLVIFYTHLYFTTCTAVCSVVR